MGNYERDLERFCKKVSRILRIAANGVAEWEVGR
jgi:hypothetical protein